MWIGRLNLQRKRNAKFLISGGCGCSCHGADDDKEEDRGAQGTEIRYFLLRTEFADDVYRLPSMMCVLFTTINFCCSGLL